MASVASQLIQEVTAHAQSDSLLDDAQQICADSTYLPNNLRTYCSIFIPIFINNNNNNNNNNNFY